jgi:RHS repeat-associated protein
VTTIGSGYDITATSYDWRNLPTSMTKSGTTTYNYRYDHAGLRVYKEEGADIHTLRGAFGEALATFRNDTLDYWNILRPDGTVIGRRDSGGRLYYIRDHLGSTRTIINATGGVEQTYDYYPFGLDMPQRMSQTGDYARERFTGHERDEEVGLDYMQARRYAAEFGRFLSVDPLADDFPALSPYNYTFNNPLRYIDPDGQAPLHTIVEENEDGTYRVVGGDPNDGDTGIYVGSTDGEKIGESLTTHSFFDSNDKAVVGAQIDLESTEGQDFIDNDILGNDPGLLSAYKFQHGGDLDFKRKGETENMTNQQRDAHRHRGSKTSNKKIASARDFGNMAAGIVAGRAGLSLKRTRNIFDFYQGGTEPAVSAYAQNYGWRMGVYIRITRDN